MDSTPQNVFNQDLNRCLALCGFTLVLYDYILTFPLELERFWSPLQMRQWGTFIFIVNRYIGLLGHVPIIYSYFFVPPPDPVVGQQDSRCYPLHKYHQFLAVAVQTSVGAIMLTRVYALWERNRIILWGLLGYYFGFAGFAAVRDPPSLHIRSPIYTYWWAITRGRSQDYPSVPPNSLGCVSVLSKNEGFYFCLVWSGIMIFDSTVFALTVYRTVSLWRQGSRGLVHIVMRDGLVYYAVLGFSTLANTLTFVLGSAFTRGINTLMTNMLACAVCSRIMLNLRDPKLSGYLVETSITCDAPSSAELTAVVMNDMYTSQIGAEERAVGACSVGVAPRT